MKIAAVSDDGMTISQHFGRASSYYSVSYRKKELLCASVSQKGEEMGFCGGFAAAKNPFFPF